MPTFDELLQGVPSRDDFVGAGLAPFLVALLLSALAVRLAAGGRRGAGWGAALGLGAGYVAAHLTLWGAPDMPPLVASDWLVLLLPLAALAGAWNGSGERAPRFAGLAGLTTAGAVAFVTLRPRVKAGAWDAEEVVLWCGGLALAVVLAALGAARSAARAPARDHALLALALAGLASVAIGMSGSQKLAQAAGAVAAGLTGVLLAALPRSDAAGRLATGAAPVWSAAVGGLLLNAHLYAELGLDAFALLLAPAVLAPALSVGPWTRWPGLAGSVGRVALLALPALAGAALAVTRFQPTAGYY